MLIPVRMFQRQRVAGTWAIAREMARSHGGGIEKPFPVNVYHQIRSVLVDNIKIQFLEDYQEKERRFLEEWAAGRA